MEWISSFYSFALASESSLPRDFLLSHPESWRKQQQCDLIHDQPLDEAISAKQQFKLLPGIIHRLLSEMLNWKHK